MPDEKSAWGSSPGATASIRRPSPRRKSSLPAPPVEAVVHRRVGGRIGPGNRVSAPPNEADERRRRL